MVPGIALLKYWHFTGSPVTTLGSGCRLAFGNTSEAGGEQCFGHKLWFRVAGARAPQFDKYFPDRRLNDFGVEGGHAKIERP